MMSRIVAAATLAAALCAAPSLAGAQSLPAFPLVSPDGQPAGSAALQAPGQWLLAYVVPGSGPSDRLVQALGENWTPARAARIIFIVAGSAADAKTYLASKGGEALAADAQWYADPEGHAWSALEFQGTLAVAGMSGQAIDWKVDGVISDPEVLRPAIAKWLDGGEASNAGTGEAVKH